MLLSAHVFEERHREAGRTCKWTTAKTDRSEYVVDAVTTACVVLCKPLFPTRWRDMDMQFRIRTSATDEVLYQVIDSLVKALICLLEAFRAELLKNRAKTSANATRKQGTPLTNCIGFIDYTKIRVCRPIGRGYL